MARLFIAIHVPPTPPIEVVLRKLDRLGPTVRPVAAEQLHLTLRFLGQTPEDRAAPIAAALDRAVAAAGVGPFELHLKGLGRFPGNGSFRAADPGPKAPRVVFAVVAAPPGDTSRNTAGGSEASGGGRAFGDHGASGGASRSCGDSGEPGDRLRLVAAMLDQELAGLDPPIAPEDRPLAVHLTLGRVKIPRRRPGKRTVPALDSLGALQDLIEAHSTTDLGHVCIDAVHLIQSTLTPRGPIYQVRHTSVLGPGPDVGRH